MNGLDRGSFTKKNPLRRHGKPSRPGELVSEGERSKGRPQKRKARNVWTNTDTARREIAPRTKPAGDHQKGFNGKISTVFFRIWRDAKWQGSGERRRGKPGEGKEGAPVWEKKFRTERWGGKGIGGHRASPKLTEGRRGPSKRKTPNGDRSKRA